MWQRTQRQKRISWRKKKQKKKRRRGEAWKIRVREWTKVMDDLGMQGMGVSVKIILEQSVCLQWRVIWSPSGGPFCPRLGWPQISSDPISPNHPALMSVSTAIWPLLSASALIHYFYVHVCTVSLKTGIPSVLDRRCWCKKKEQSEFAYNSICINHSFFFFFFF